MATQNIDGLHQSAGSRNVIELHGNLRRVICTHCDYQIYRETFEGMAGLPLCPECRKILRPDAVLYEEQLPDDALGQFEFEQDRGFDLVFSVGTTSIFSITSPSPLPPPLVRESPWWRSTQKRPRFRIWPISDLSNRQVKLCTRCWRR